MMDGKKQILFELLIMDILYEELGPYDVSDDEMRKFMDVLHQYVENAAQDFAMDNNIEYTPVY